MAKDVSAFGHHLKFLPYMRKTGGTQGRNTTPTRTKVIPFIMMHGNPFQYKKMENLKLYSVLSNF